MFRTPATVACTTLCAASSLVLVFGEASLGQEVEKKTQAVLVAQTGHIGSYWGGVRLALSADNKVLFSGGYYGVCMWEVSTGREIRSFRGQSSEVSAIALSSDGKLLANGGEDEAVHVWNVDTGEELRTFKLQWVSALTFSNDGKQLVTGDWYGTVRIWDVATGKKLVEFKVHKDRRVYSLAVSKDGALLAMGCADGSVTICKLSNGTTVRNLPGHAEMVRSMAFTHNGKWLGAGSWDGNTRILDPFTGKEVRTLVSKQERITSLAISGDDKFLVTGTYDRVAHLWNVATGEHIRSFKGERDRYEGNRLDDRPVYSVVISNDGKWFITGNPDKKIQMWDVATGRVMREFAGLAARASIVLSSDNRLLATSGGEDNTTRFWDLAQGKVSDSLPGRGCCALSTDNAWYLATGRLEKSAQLRTTASGKVIHQFDHPNDVGFVDSGAISHNKKHVASGGHFGTTLLWDAATGKQLRTLKKHHGYVNSLAFTSDDKWLVTGGHDGARVSEVETGKEVRFLQHEDHIFWKVVVSKDDKWLVTSGKDKTARLWNLATGEQVRAFTGHMSGVGGLALSDDGKWLATGSEDRTAKLWDLATGKVVCTFLGHTSDVYDVAFTKDGNRLLTSGSGDGSVRIWDIATGKELCRLFTFGNGNWAAHDSQGRFDASSKCEGLHWVVGNQTFPLNRFEQFHDPQLVAKHLGLSKQPLKEVEP